ncbi:MAG: KdsC family phosphatase [Candidatus Kapaibacteriales bacterium]
MEDKVIEKLKKIKLLAMDVDGTLTNGQVYYSRNGEELKAFSIRDGLGLEILQNNGISTCIITSEASQIISARATRLKIKHVILASKNKKRDLLNLAEEVGIKIDEFAFIGDDLNDISAIEVVGFSACPSNAIKYVREKVDYICKNEGGNGAVREVVELILEAKGIEIKYSDF